MFSNKKSENIKDNFIIKKSSSFTAVDNIKEIKIKAKKNIIKEKEEPIVQPKKIVEKKVNISQSNKDIIQTLKKKYYTYPNKEMAIILAKKYYETGFYKSTIFWCKKANEFDNTLEESWYLYAKSKVKLGEIKGAIRALELYLTRYNSTKIVDLLDRINSGKF
jgi:tetratricopeptide (TPR) repeat protein